jgi:multimeric flavodoxin WrbA
MSLLLPGARLLAANSLRQKEARVKVLTIMGSPRKTGNTNAVLTWVEDELKKQGHEVDRANVAGKGINGCISCYKCQGPDVEFECVQRDDGTEILDKLKTVDAIVVGTPLYCWSFTGQLKPLLDRFLSQAKGYMTPEHTSSIEGKPMALVVTCAGQIDDNADLLPQIFGRMTRFLKANLVDMLVVPGCTDKPSEGAEENARKLAATLTG